MTLLYYFCNASVTSRVLAYLRKKLDGAIECVTVIFFNEFWIVRIQLKSCIIGTQLENCCAVLKENGLPYQNYPWLEQIFSELDAGCDLTAIMNYHHIVIVLHGAPQFDEIEHFRRHFISGLGYCPPSLV